mgnify:CR=1 FL=1
MQSLEQTFQTFSLTLLTIGAISLALLALLSLTAKRLTEKRKEILFLLMVAAILVPTMFLIASTVYLNTISASGGPVHWHADIEVWNCGKELDLEDPKGLSNKIGEATLHEHDDKRIHVEGVVIESHDASLGNYFRAMVES